MSGLPNIGRFLYAVPLLIFGLFHFMNAKGMAAMVPLPGGAIWVYITGIALVAAAISIMIGKMDRLAATLLGVMLLIFALSLHLPGVIESGGENQGAMSNFLKDTALAGAAWMYTTMARDK